VASDLYSAMPATFSFIHLLEAICLDFNLDLLLSNEIFATHMFTFFVSLTGFKALAKDVGSDCNLVGNPNLPLLGCGRCWCGFLEEEKVSVFFFLEPDLLLGPLFGIFGLTSFLGASPRFTGAGRLSVDSSSSMFTLNKKTLLTLKLS